MAKNVSSQRLLYSAFGIVSLIATLGSSAPLVSIQSSAITNDIAITMTQDHNNLRSGQQVTFTVVMINRGPDDATFVDLAFDLPAQLKVISMACDLGISADGPFCEYSSLPAGVSVVSKLVATTNTGAQARSRLLKTAASAMFEDPGVLDPDLANNTAAVKTRRIGRTSGL